MTDKSKLVSFVDKSVKDEIQKIAQKYGMSESMLIRLIVQQWLEEGGRIEIK